MILLTFWRSFFLILAHSVYKIWITQEANTLQLWNKLHFEEKITESMYHVSNIQYLYLLNKYIKMQRLEVSGAVRPLYGSLGVKGLRCIFYIINFHQLSFNTAIQWNQC